MKGFGAGVGSSLGETYGGGFWRERLRAKSADKSSWIAIVGGSTWKADD